MSRPLNGVYSKLITDAGGEPEIAEKRSKTNALNTCRNEVDRRPFVRLPGGNDGLYKIV